MNSLSTSNSILVLDLKSALNGEDDRGTPWAYDAAKAVAALQGIVNRDTPRLFVLYLPNAIAREKGRQTQPGDIDRFWLDWLCDSQRLLSDYSIVETSDLWQVLKTFKSEIRGLTVWDKNVPATANVASTLAGAMNLLPVRGSSGEDSFYRQVKRQMPDLKIEVDLRDKFTGTGQIPETNLASTGSAKCDAYIWAVETILKGGLCSSTHFAYYLDGVQWTSIAPKCSSPYPDLANAGLLNADYWISHKAFFFDLSPWDDEPATDDLEQPPGTDVETLTTILKTANSLNNGDEMMICGGFVPWWLKYCAEDWGGRDPSVAKRSAVPAEWRFVDILSAHNTMLDADAYGLTALANASIYRHHPLKNRYEQSTPSSQKKYDPEKTYVLFAMLDYDSSAWLAQAYSAIWQDPKRGQIPLFWGFNPILSDRVPMVFDAIFESLTPNDTVGVDEGLGYVNPELLDGDRKFSDLSAASEMYLQQARPYLDKFSMTTSAFVITGDYLASQDTTLKMLAELTPKGVGFQGSRVEDGVYHGTAFKAEQMDWSHSMTVADSAKHLENHIREKSPGGFVFFRCILLTPSHIWEAVEMVKRNAPDLNFEVIDPISCFDFMQRYYESQ